MMKFSLHGACPQILTPDWSVCQNPIGQSISGNEAAVRLTSGALDLLVTVLSLTLFHFSDDFWKFDCGYYHIRIRNYFGLDFGNFFRIKSNSQIVCMSVFVFVRNDLELELLLIRNQIGL